jgi:hypothetical protein
MPTLHLLSALLSLTAFAGSLGERGASAWGRCAAAVMAIAMVGALDPARQLVPGVLWSAALVALAIGASIAHRRAGHHGVDALRMPLSAVLMGALVATAGVGHSGGVGASGAVASASDHHGGASIALVVLLAAGSQVALCLSELRRGGPSESESWLRRRGAITLRAGAMGGAAVVMATAVLAAS